MKDTKNRIILILIIAYLVILSSNFFIVHNKITGKVAGEVNLFVKAQGRDEKPIEEPQKSIIPQKEEPIEEPQKSIIPQKEEPIKEPSIEDLLKEILEKGTEDKVIDLNTNTEGSKDISAKDKIFLFISPKIYHYISIKEINDKDVILNIYSDSPITVKLMLKETKEIDLNRDGLNDISITLEDIILDTAIINIKKLVGVNKIIEDSEEIKTLNTLWYIIYALFTIIIILVIFILSIIKKRYRNLYKY